MGAPLRNCEPSAHVSEHDEPTSTLRQLQPLRNAFGYSEHVTGVGAGTMAPQRGASGDCASELRLRSCGVAARSATVLLVRSRMVQYPMSDALATPVLLLAALSASPALSCEFQMRRS